MVIIKFKKGWVQNKSWLFHSSNVGGRYLNLTCTENLKGNWSDKAPWGPVSQGSSARAPPSLQPPHSRQLHPVPNSPAALSVLSLPAQGPGRAFLPVLALYLFQTWPFWPPFHLSSIHWYCQPPNFWRPKVLSVQWSRRGKRGMCTRS